MMLKSNAGYKPQEHCKFFREYTKSFECTALTQCWCCLEAKACHFYKSTDGVEQGRHEPCLHEKKPLTKEKFEEIKAYHFGRTWKRAAEKFGYTKKQVEIARQKYDPDYVPEERKKYPDEMLRKAVRMNADGMAWKEIGRVLGAPGSSIKARIDRDARKGVYYH